MATTETMPVISSPESPTPTGGSKSQEQSPIIVYKIVSVVDNRRESLAMQVCTAIYKPGRLTYPPLPNSPLFAYRTLEAAQKEYDRFVDLNAWRPIHFTPPPMEIWLAQTTGELACPSRIPSIGYTIYPGLLKKCGYGATLADGYAFFWRNTSYCLKHIIGKRAGQKLDASITICCKDLILLELIR